MEPQLRIKDMDRRSFDNDSRLEEDTSKSGSTVMTFNSTLEVESPQLKTYLLHIHRMLKLPSCSPATTVSMQGQYAYVDGINNGVYILPEGEFTLEITREEAMMDGNKGYFQYPAGGADGSKSDGPTLHTIDGGAFNISITAPQ